MLHQLGGRGRISEAAKAFRCEAGGGEGCQDQGDNDFHHNFHGDDGDHYDYNGDDAENEGCQDQGDHVLHHNLLACA